MKAIVCTKYGPPDVLKLKDVERPVPKNNQILIKIVATSVTAADYRIRGLNVPTGFGLLMRIVMGFRKPRKRILGMNLSGVVDAVGKDIKLFKEGDPVFGTSGMDFGAYAEYICMPEPGLLAMKPNVMTYEEAAAFPFGALTALSFLRDKGNIQGGEKILIYGASGAVGTAAVQLAKYYDTDVTGVCSTTNLEMVKSLGADRVIDYTKEDFTNNGETYDIIFDTVGKTSISRCKSSLTQKGRYLAAVAGLPQYAQMLWNSMIGSKKFTGGVASENKEDFIFLKELIESGNIKTVIDRCYSLEQTAEAHRYAEKGHKKGNVVITVENRKT